PWNEAQILVAGPNFGCGSSREGAPRALREHGFRAIVAPSFGDIFYNNCFRNGIVPIRLDAEIVETLGNDLLAHAGQPLKLEVDLAATTLTVPHRGETHTFAVPRLLHHMLLHGID